MVFLSLSFLRQISENCNPPLQFVLPHHPLTIVTPYNLGFLTDHSPKISLFITKSDDKFLVLTSLDLLFNLVIIQLYLLSQKHSIIESLPEHYFGNLMQLSILFLFQNLQIHYSSKCYVLSCTKNNLELHSAVQSTKCFHIHYLLCSSECCSEAGTARFIILT